MHPGSAFVQPPLSATPPESTSDPTYPDEVGALLAQAALLRHEQPLDEITRALWAEALSRALTGQASKPR